MMINTNHLLQTLSQKRPIFHSEADFQHALAWQMQQTYPNLNVRLEFPFERDNDVNHVDIWSSSHGSNVAIELKYKTESLSCTLDREKFQLKSHSAQNDNRYSVLKDVERLEYLASKHPNTTGYMIFITNDSQYWRDLSRRREPKDAEFRLHEGRKIHGLLKSRNTNKSRNLHLEGTYQANWFDYSSIPNVQHGNFKVLTFAVNNEKTEIVSDVPNDLARMLDRITVENLHDEIKTGEPVGLEVW